MAANKPLAMVRRYAAISWRKRWIGIGVAWVIATAGWVGVLMLPNVYESSVRLYVQADAVLTPLLKGLALDNTVNDQLDLMQKTLLSRPNLVEVISRTPLARTVHTAQQKEKLIDRLGTAIKVVPQDQNLFTISYRNADPQTARDVVQAVLDIFVQSRSGSSQEDMANAQNFLQQQITSYETQLRAAEKAKAEFRAHYIDVLPADDGTSRLEAARSNEDVLKGQLTDASARETLLKKQIADLTPAARAPTSVTIGNSSEVAAAQQTLDRLLLTETDNHPDVQRQREVLRMLQSRPQTRVTIGGGGAQQPNPAYSQLTVELIDAQTSIASLRRKIAAAEDERAHLEQVARGAPALQAQYMNMSRDYDTLKTNYGALLARRESMRLGQAAADQANQVKLRVVDPAQVSKIPVAPPRMVLTILILMAALGAGIASLLGLAQIDHSFRTTDELRAVGLPVLGGISFAASETSQSRHRLAIITATAATGALFILCGCLILKMKFHNLA